MSTTGYPPSEATQRHHRRVAAAAADQTPGVLLALPDVRPAHVTIAPPVEPVEAAAPQVHTSAAEPVHGSRWRYDPAEENRPPVSHEAWKLAMRRLVSRRDKAAAVEHRKMFYVGLATVAATLAAMMSFSTFGDKRDERLPALREVPSAFSQPVPITTETTQRVSSARESSPTSALSTAVTPSTMSPPAQMAPAPIEATPTSQPPSVAPRAPQNLTDPKDVPPWESWPSHDKVMTPPPSSNSAASNEPPTSGEFGLAQEPTLAPSRTMGATPMQPLGPPVMVAPGEPVQMRSRLKGQIQKTTARPAHDPIGPGVH
ncbi:MAG TPA: hypothetical protein VHV77_13045 [Pirellulales bacterium]|nr:hypothetical protein [Pirellulales bacterium]